MESKPRALVMGVLSYVFFLAATLAVGLVVLCVLGILFSFRFLDHIVPLSESSRPWLSAVLNIIPLVGCGYVASALIETRKVLIGFLTGCIILLIHMGYYIPQVLASEDWVATLSSGFFGFALASLLTAALLLPTLGAFAEMKRPARKEPFPVKKMFFTVAANCAVFVGLFMMVSGILIGVLCPSVPNQTWWATRPLQWGLLGVGGAMVAYFLIKMRGMAGWKKGVFRNPVVYATCVFVAIYAVAFVHRDAVNKPSSENLEKIAAAMNERYAIPDEKNGAFLWEDVFEAIEGKMMEIDTQEALDSGLWRKADHPEWTEWLEKHESIFSVAQEAAAREVTYFPLKVKYIDWDLENASFARSYTRIACLASRGRAGEGRIEESVEYLEPVFPLAEAFSKGPHISMATGISCRHLVIETLAQILRDGNLQRLDLIMIMSKLDQWSEFEFPSPDAWQAYPELEAAEAEEEFFEQLCDSGVESYLVRLWVPRGLMAEVADETWGMGFDGKSMLEILREDDQRKIQVHLFKLQNGSVLERVKGILGWLGKVPLTRIARYLLEDEAAWHVLKGYTAARLFEMDNGTLPRAWEDLVPQYLEETPSDPFLNEPLGLEASDSGLRIFSVGRNQTDDGIFNNYIFEQNDSKDENAPRGDDIGVRIVPNQAGGRP